MEGAYSKSDFDIQWGNPRYWYKFASAGPFSPIMGTIHPEFTIGSAKREDAD